jgi:hypothetical protein
MFDDEVESTVPDALRLSELPSDWGEDDELTRDLRREEPNLGIEIVRVEEPPSLAPDDRWTAVEIWTKNRVYHIDAAMACIGVVRRATGLRDDRSECLGARLGGGQARRGDVAELSHPLPMPGTEAVFELVDGSRKKFLATSTVERVILRVGVVQVEPPRAEPTWKEITGRSVPPGAFPEAPPR